MTEKSLAKLIGENVRSVRLAAGLTQDDVRKKTGIAVPHLSRLETGSHLPSLATVLRVANALGVGICQLVEKPKRVKK